MIVSLIVSWISVLVLQMPDDMSLAVSVNRETFATKAECEADLKDQGMRYYNDVLLKMGIGFISGHCVRVDYTNQVEHRPYMP